MTFDELFTQTVELLQREGRVSYRALKRRFALDDDYLEDLKVELIAAKRLAIDEDGKVLVWGGKGETAKGGKGEDRLESSVQRLESTNQPLAPSTQPPAGERRQLTVMFIDLVGSTTLSQQLDPEDYHVRVVAYQTA